MVDIDCVSDYITFVNTLHPFLNDSKVAVVTPALHSCSVRDTAAGRCVVDVGGIIETDGRNV